MAGGRARWIGPALAAAGAALYLLALGNDWTLDDRLFVFDDALVRDLARFPSIFTRDYWWFLPYDALYRPVTVASMALQHAVAGDAPWSYRLVNAFLHGAAVWLLFALLRRRLGVAAAPAALGALVFAAHPAGSEAVVQLVGRADLFVALVALALLHLHLADYRLAGLGPAFLVPAALVLLLAALGAKESAVAIPPLLLAADVVRGTVRRRPGVLAATLVLTLIFWFGLRAPLVAGVPRHPTLDNPLFALRFDERLPGVLGVLGRYAALLVFPLHLSADYSYAAVPGRPALDDPWVVTGALAVVGSAVAFLWAWRRGRVGTGIGVALVWLPLLPVSNLVVPIGTVLAERFLYLSAAGVGVLAAGLLAERRGLQPVALAIVLAFAVRTGLRERDWRDEVTLSARTAEGSRSGKAHYHYALVLHGLGQREAAEAEYRRALEIRADDVRVLLDFGRLLEETGRWNDAEQVFARAVATRVDDPEPFVQLAQVYQQLGRGADATPLLQRAAAMTPSSYRGWYAMGVTRFTLGDEAGARSAFERALELKPGDALARFGLARVSLYGEGRPAEAAETLAALVRDAPDLASAWYDLGESYSRLGRRDDAVRALEQAERLLPGDPGVRARLERERGAGG